MGDGQAPVWQAWDGQTYGKHFHGRELTLVGIPKQAGTSTTYRLLHNSSICVQSEPFQSHCREFTPA